ncbi:MAG: hypothetical protein LBD03_05630 [Methanobrevibacter sp.]|jgi:pterin-4a-carbinolamine dehydratase|nr:hypothetical protein [Candidatus Methanovirga procula]
MSKEKFDFSTKEKDFDAIKFKRILQENLWKRSKAKNFKEYIDYVNEVASKSRVNKYNYIK